MQEHPTARNGETDPPKTVFAVIISFFFLFIFHTTGYQRSRNEGSLYSGGGRGLVGGGVGGGGGCLEPSNVPLFTSGVNQSIKVRILRLLQGIVLLRWLSAFPRWVYSAPPPSLCQSSSKQKGVLFAVKIDLAFLFASRFSLLPPPPHPPPPPNRQSSLNSCREDWIDLAYLSASRFSLLPPPPPSTHLAPARPASPVLTLVVKIELIFPLNIVRNLRTVQCQRISVYRCPQSFVDYLSIQSDGVLFSASKQTHCALVAFDSN